MDTAEMNQNEVEPQSIPEGSEQEMILHLRIGISSAGRFNILPPFIERPLSTSNSCAPEKDGKQLQSTHAEAQALFTLLSRALSNRDESSDLAFFSSARYDGDFAQDGRAYVENRSIKTSKNSQFHRSGLSLDASKDLINPSAEPVDNHDSQELADSLKKREECSAENVPLYSEMKEEQELGAIPNVSPTRRPVDLSTASGDSLGEIKQDEPFLKSRGDDYLDRTAAHTQYSRGRTSERSLERSSGVYQDRRALNADRSSAARPRDAAEFLDRRNVVSSTRKDWRYDDAKGMHDAHPNLRPYRSQGFRDRDARWEIDAPDHMKASDRFDRDKSFRDRRHDVERDPSFHRPLAASRMEISNDLPISEYMIDAYNINFLAKDFEIREFFEQAGPVRAMKLNMDINTGRFRGSATVTYKSYEGYRNALEMTKANFKGRCVVIYPSLRRSRSPHDLRDDRNLKRSRVEPDEALAQEKELGILELKNLPSELNAAAIEKEASRYGQVLRVRGPYPEEGSKQLTCMVEYRTPVEAKQAMESLDDREVAGVRIRARVVMPAHKGRESLRRDVTPNAGPRISSLQAGGASAPSGDSAKTVCLQSSPILEEWEIFELFDEIGKVAKVEIDTAMGGPLVVCVDENVASRAVAKSGIQFRGRAIRISHVPSSKGKASSAAGSVERDDMRGPTSSFSGHFIEGLPRDMEVNDVKEFLIGACAELEECILSIERRGRAIYVELEGEDSGDRIQALDGLTFEGNEIIIERA